MIKTQTIKITNKVTAKVDLESLANMAYRIDSSANLSLNEVEKTLDTLSRDIENLSAFSGVDNKALSNRIDYALRQLKMGRNTISQIQQYYELDEVLN